MDPPFKSQSLGRQTVTSNFTSLTKMTNLVKRKLSSIAIKKGTNTKSPRYKGQKSSPKANFLIKKLKSFEYVI